MKALLLTLTTCLFVLPAQAKYSGGTGDPNDPYQIATAADLILLGESPSDYGKHFILTADIDLDPSLPGRKVFDKALIAPGIDPKSPGFQGTSFTGVFDGNGHKLLNYKGSDAIFGCVVGAKAEVRNLRLATPEVLALDFACLDCANPRSSLVAYLYDGTVSNCDVQDCNVFNLSSAPDGTGGLVAVNNGGTIIDCHVTGQVCGDRHEVGGLVASNSRDGTILYCSFSGSLTGGGWWTGGLVGYNTGGISFCYSTGAVSGGSHKRCGGLVALNEGVISNCYSTSNVRGGVYDWPALFDRGVAGLVGENGGIVSNCYSTGAVSGKAPVGGLVGLRPGDVAGCFWDIQTSGRATSAGGVGKTTAQMQTAKTFLDAGWDFMGETANGTEDIWWILEGKDYPRFLWEQGQARVYRPSHGALDLLQPVVLHWGPGGRGMLHDVYLGQDEAAVASATPASPGIYRDRQRAEMVTYEPGNLDWGKTYYWRIDEVNQTDPNSVWKGDVWSFTTADFIVATIDDFEGYTDDYRAGKIIWQTWICGRDNGTGSWVGNFDVPYAEQVIVHGGQQSMPMVYLSDSEPWYSEAERTWETPQDWTIAGADTLTLFVQGQADNSREQLYVAIEDSAGLIAVVPHPDPNAVLATQWQRGIFRWADLYAVPQWQKWHIPLADLRVAGVDPAAVKKMAIGVGDRNNPRPGGTGKIYIDDIRLTKRMP